MPPIRNIFNGGLNLDDSIHLMPKGSYTDALNTTRDAVESLHDLAITNIVGNQKVNYSLPSGTNVCIGARADIIRNVVYYFVWNSNDKHSILLYTRSSGVISKLMENLTDTNNVDVLMFGRYNKITHIDIVYNDEDGDLVYWTDAINLPRKINVSTIQSFVPITEDIINAAKNAPNTPLDCEYKDDTSVNVNNLRGQLFQFAYSWVYDDGEESTLSSLSEVPLPIGGYDPDTQNNPTKNNNIQITLNAGGKDCYSIKLYGRSSLGTTWSDYFLIDTFVLADYSIAPFGTYDYLFYNDGVYPFQDPIKTGLQYTWLPDLANAQALANGSNLVYGGITEGWNNLARTDVDVTMTAGTGSVGSPSISGVLNTNNTITVQIGATVTNGTVYTIQVGYDDNGGPEPDKLFSYTAVVPNDDQDAVTTQLELAIIGDGTFNAANMGGGVLLISRLPLSNVNFNLVVTSISNAGSENVAAAWKWTGKYRFGLIYFNDLMKPLSIISFVGSSTDTTDFVVNTPDYSLVGGIIQVPFINASINHTPPVGATTYQWLRTNNLNAQSFLYWITNDYQTDSDYLYFCIQNLTYQHTKNTGFVPSYEFKKGDHIRVLAQYNAGTITQYSAQLDFEIVGTETRTMNSPASNGTFIKCVKPSTLPTPSFSANMVVEIYTPSIHDSDSSIVLYEWGQEYEIYENSGNFYHRGQLTDQTAIQPATFQWFNGDIYSKTRNLYLNVDATSTITQFTMDANYNDYFVSAVNSNGRAWALEPDAAVTYLPTTVRFSQTYFQDGTVNGLNIFYYDDKDLYNRAYGDIFKLYVKDSYMKVGQKFKIGDVPIFLQMVKDQTGDNTLAISDKLLNQIVYYAGDFGIGEAPESWAVYNYAIYGCDTNRGIIWRLSQDGIIPISILYKVNSWATAQIPQRTGNYKIYGAYDAKANNYIAALEATGGESAYTLTFDEENNQFESFMSYQPEMMCTLGTLLISFKNGELWTHDADYYNRFYGTDYESNISAVFNDFPDAKKTWSAIAEVANTTWDCPLIYTNTNTYGSQRQESKLIEQNFTILEGMPSSSILRDLYSPGGWNNGDWMKGTYMVVKFRKSSASDLVYLSEVSMRVIDSPLNVLT